MKHSVIIFGMLLASVATGCSSSFYREASYSSDDLYGLHDRKSIAEEQQARAEVRRAEAEARRAQWEALLAEAEAADAEAAYYDSNPYEDVLADTYESAYARRLRGFESPTYRMPSSYYNLCYSGEFTYLTAYDPAFYNIMVSGDEVWVEPKYITSMFGTWGATPYYGNWYYGWDYYWPYRYGWWGWGYPSFAIGSWGWSFGFYPWYNPWYRYGWYDPWWGPAWGPGWYGGHIHYRPHNIVNRPSYSRPDGSLSGRSSSFTTRPGRVNGLSGRSNSLQGGRTFGSGTRGGSSSFNRGSSSSFNRGSSSSFNRGSSSSFNRNNTRGTSSFNRDSNRGTSSFDRGSSPFYNSGSSFGGGFSGGSRGGGGSVGGRNAGGR